MYALMKWTGKGGFYQPNTETVATNTTIPHVNWLDLFERSCGKINKFFQIVVPNKTGLPFMVSKELKRVHE